MHIQDGHIHANVIGMYAVFMGALDYGYVCMHPGPILPF